MRISPRRNARGGRSTSRSPETRPHPPRRRSRRWRAVALFAAVLAGCQSDSAADAGRALIARYGCQSCHVIPGAPQPQGVTGPPLDATARQSYVAGVVPSTPETLAAFIASPQAVDPRSAMPDLGVPDDEAAAMAAYLIEASR